MSLSVLLNLLILEDHPFDITARTSPRYLFKIGKNGCARWAYFVGQLPQCVLSRVWGQGQ